MLQPITLLIKDPVIIQGLLDGTLVRYGSVIRYAAGTGKGGQIFKHLSEVPGILDVLKFFPASPASPLIDTIGHGLTYHKLMGVDRKLTGITHQLFGIEKTLGSVMGLTQIAAGASVLNLGVSIAGFAYMGFKLHQIQKSLGHLQQTMEIGFQRVEAGLHHLDNKMTEGFTVVIKGLNYLDDRLDTVSGQLAYLYLLVQDSRQKQETSKTAKTR